MPRGISIIHNEVTRLAIRKPRVVPLLLLPRKELYILVWERLIPDPLVLYLQTKLMFASILVNKNHVNLVYTLVIVWVEIFRHHSSILGMFGEQPDRL